MTYSFAETPSSHAASWLLTVHAQHASFVGADPVPRYFVEHSHSHHQVGTCTSSINIIMSGNCAHADKASLGIPICFAGQFYRTDCKGQQPVQLSLDNLARHLTTNVHSGILIACFWVCHGKQISGKTLIR